jgi:hypothetical protein
VFLICERVGEVPIDGQWSLRDSGMSDGAFRGFVVRPSGHSFSETSFNREAHALSQGRVRTKPPTVVCEVHTRNSCFLVFPLTFASMAVKY